MHLKNYIYNRKTAKQVPQKHNKKQKNKIKKEWYKSSLPSDFSRYNGKSYKYCTVLNEVMTAIHFLSMAISIRKFLDAETYSNFRSNRHEIFRKEYVIDEFSSQGYMTEVFKLDYLFCQRS